MIMLKKIVYLTLAELALTLIDPVNPVFYFNLLQTLETQTSSSEASARNKESLIKTLETEKPRIQEKSKSIFNYGQQYNEIRGNIY